MVKMCVIDDNCVQFAPYHFVTDAFNHRIHDYHVDQLGSYDLSYKQEGRTEQPGRKNRGRILSKPDRKVMRSGRME